ncbi:unnamed protein product [Dibothriocephalus latus]|uniref:Transforming acidic coiled-coil-containing protein C-terminal domain-containing protein n=1 Tax=Dibothriocephalus latus TaxID=60516 RepID=A0A3P6TTX9_DIBLA|nr:unnamed protein product [Dibothriocephalus latus]
MDCIAIPGGERHAKKLKLSNRQCSRVSHNKWTFQNGLFIGHNTGGNTTIDIFGKVRELEADHQYAAQRHEEEIKDLFQVARARELQMAESIEELSRLKDDKLSQAASLITQYRSMLLKLREESRTGIELFDSTLEAFGRKHKCLANMATAAQSLANKTEQEMQRLREETVDHLHQADLNSKEVWRLEEAVAKKDRQITSLKRDMTALVSEIEFLRDELARHLPEDDRFVSERMFSGNHEVTDILSRFKNMKTDWDI